MTAAEFFDKSCDREMKEIFEPIRIEKATGSRRARIGSQVWCTWPFTPCDAGLPAGGRNSDHLWP